MKRIAFSLVFFASLGVLHAQVWTWQHPKPQGNNLNAVTFYNESIGFAVGDNGTILQTTDGGKTWIERQSGVTANLLTVCISSENQTLVVAAGTNDTYVYSADGGATWDTGHVPIVPNTLNWRGSAYYTGHNIFLCGDNGYIVESTDNGATFTTFARSPTIHNERGTTDTLYSITFFAGAITKASRGIAIGGNSLVCVTSDGGAIWRDTIVKTPQKGIRLRGVSVSQVNAASDGYAAGYDVVGNGTIWYTTNFGLSWSAPPVPSLAYTSIGMAGTGAPIYAVSQQGAATYAANEGGAWNTDGYFNNNTTQLNAVCWPTANFGCVVGNAGKIYIRSAVVNNFQWVERDTGGSAPLQDIAFTDTKNGYACGDNGAVVITTNGGARWKDTQIGGIDTLWSISFADAKHGYTAGDSGRIFYTSNGGTSWSQQQSGVSMDITCIRAVDSAAAYACSLSGTILYTQNAGGKWDSVASATSNPLAKVVFLNRNIGWAMARQDSVYRTIDGGTTWQGAQVTANPAITLKGVWFADILHGWVVGSQGFLAGTNDAGSTWTALDSTHFTPQANSGMMFNAVGFIDSLNGWIAGSNGVIYYSTDAGRTWHAQISGTVNDLFGLNMVDVSNGWTCGNSGAILKFSSGSSSLSMLRVIDFGKVAFGLKKDTTVVLRNTGSSLIPINSASNVIAAPVDRSNIPGQFTLNTSLSPIQPNGTMTLDFSFQPLATADTSQSRLRASVITVEGQNGVDAPVTLIGRGEYATIVFANGDSVLDFGQVFVGHCKVLTLAIQNTGEIPVTLSALLGNVNGGPDSVFTVLDPNKTIVPGAIDTVHLQYCPRHSQIDNGSVAFGGVPSPITAALKGVGEQNVLAASPKRVDMTFCTEGELTIEVRNLNGTTWQMSNPIVRNPDGYLKLINTQNGTPPNGAKVGAPGNPLYAAESCYFYLQLTDALAPPATCDSTWLVFEDQAGDPVDSMFLSWCDKGTSLNNQDAYFSHGGSFDSCIAVGTCDSEMVTWTNAGYIIKLDSIKIVGKDAGEFSWSGIRPPHLEDTLNRHIPYYIPVGDSIQLWIKYCPTAPGDDSDAQVVCYYPLCPDSVDVEDFNANIFGACAISGGWTVTPACLMFDSLQLGGTQTSETISNALTINFQGHSADTIYVHRKPGLPDFSFSPDTIFLAPLSSATIGAAVFQPVGPGCYDDTLILTDGIETQEVCMHGCAYTNGLFWSPSGNDYGTHLVGTTICDSGYITNTGTTPVTIMQYNKQSNDGGDFTVNTSPSVPHTLAPGETLWVYICYTPKDAGNDTMTVTFTTSLGVSPKFVRTGKGYAIGQTCVSLVPENVPVSTEELGLPDLAVDINVVNPIPASPAQSFRAAIKFDTTRLLFVGIKPTGDATGWMVTPAVPPVQNGEIVFTVNNPGVGSNPPITNAGVITHVVFAPYYGSALSTLVMFDPSVLNGFKFNIMPGQDSTNPAVTCTLDTAVVTFDSVCGLSISNIVFHQGTFLYQNAPNPIAAAVGNIQFQTGVDGNVRLVVFNQFGVQMQQLVNADMKAGFHSVDVDVRALPAGSYFYELIAPDKTIVRRMVVIK